MRWDPMVPAALCVGRRLGKEMKSYDYSWRNGGSDLQVQIMIMETSCLIVYILFGFNPTESKTKAITLKCYVWNTLPGNILYNGNRMMDMSKFHPKETILLKEINTNRDDCKIWQNNKCSEWCEISTGSKNSIFVGFRWLKLGELSLRSWCLNRIVIGKISRTGWEALALEALKQFWKLQRRHSGKTKQRAVNALQVRHKRLNELYRSFPSVLQEGLNLLSWNYVRYYSSTMNTKCMLICSHHHVKIQTELFVVKSKSREDTFLFSNLKSNVLNK